MSRVRRVPSVVLLAFPFLALIPPLFSAGGKAHACVASAEDSATIISTALSAPFNPSKRVDILIANAGILRDKSFQSMTESDWDQVIAIHLKATYKCAKEVWPIMQKQKGGRIITTASGVGICELRRVLVASFNPLIYPGACFPQTETLVKVGSISSSMRGGLGP